MACRCLICKTASHNACCHIPNTRQTHINTVFSERCFNSQPVIIQPSKAHGHRDWPPYTSAKGHECWICGDKDAAKAYSIRLPPCRRCFTTLLGADPAAKSWKRVRPIGKAIVGRAMSLLLSSQPDHKGAAVSGLRHVKRKPFTWQAPWKLYKVWQMEEDPKPWRRYDRPVWRKGKPGTVVLIFVF